MTQITKEQADAALNTLWITSESCNSEEHFETIKSYIAQLEANNSELNESLCQSVNAHQAYMDANQRQPVSDEKLKEAMQWLTFYKIKNGESSRKTLSVEFHFDSIDPDTRESALSRYMRHMDEIEASLSELEERRAKDKNFEVLKDHYASGYLGSLQAAIQYENVLRTIDNWLVCSPIATAEDMAASFLPMHNLIEEVLKAHTLPTPPAQEVR